MAQYDFETVRPRYDLNAAKWQEIARYFPERPAGVIPFSVADMELPMAPQIRDGLKAFLDDYVLGYADPSEEYAASVCRFMQRRHGWTIQPDWLICTSGAIAAFYGCVKAFTAPGDGVILFTPVYYPMYSAVTANERTLVRCPLVRTEDRYEIDFDLFERLVKDPANKLLILCSPHNPGGRVWSREELERIGRLCCENGVVVASDELHFDLLAPGVEHTVFATLDDAIRDNCVVITSPSKSFNLAGLMTTNVVAPSEHLREQLRRELLTNVQKLKCNVLGHLACTIAYDQCDDWLDQVNVLVDKNRRVVTDFLAAEFPKIRPMKLEGSYLLWIDFSALGMDARDLAEMLKREAMLFFDDGYIFGAEGEGFERWNLACPTRCVQEGVDRLRAVLKKYYR